MGMIRRPVLRWHGGKWKLAPWIIAHLPPHRIYVEPFGGAASVLLRKPRAYCEIYNDLDDEVVNLFRVLRDPKRAAKLIGLLRLTPFSRTEFKRCYGYTKEPIERARRLIARSFMGHGSGAPFGRSTGFRANGNASGMHSTGVEWAGYPAALAEVVERLSGVVIEQAAAIDVMRRSDRDDTLHYVDPPYVPSTRNPGNPYDRKHKYRHELTDDDHEQLLRFLQSLQGMVVLSGYPSGLYDRELLGWRRVETAALADGANKRTEVLWLNPRADAELAAAVAHGTLFAGAA